MTEAQADRRPAGPLVYVGPDRDHFGPEYANALPEAVERGGGRISELEEAEAVVWLGPPSGLPDVLHGNVRWVQLPSAGVESWLESGVIDDRRVFTSAVGAYAGTVAEHALALMLAGGGCTSALARQSGKSDGDGSSPARPL